MRSLALLPVLALAASLAAQPNIRPGTNVTNTLGPLGSPLATSGGRIGTYPNGQQAWGVQTTSCNTGTVNVPWLRDMNIDHPQMGMWMYRLFNGRLEQISTFAGVKHGFTSTNSPGCGAMSCQNPGTGSIIGIGCSDTYGAGLNSDNYWLGPSEEVNAWLGTWTARGSLFDRGFPDVGSPQNTDGIRSLNSTMATNMGAIGNRMAIRDSDLGLAGATYYYTGYYVVRGEPEANRANNMTHRRVTTSWAGSSWNFSHPDSTQFNDSPLYRWSGANVSSNTNGGDDGRFYIAVKVTGPVNGRYHYEYVVHNRDNHRGGGSLRIPVCATALVLNPSFRDIDTDPNNDWTYSRTATEIVFTAGSLKQRWNSIYNFAFDSDAAPVAASLSIDQYDAGAGAPWVSIASQGPGDLRNLELGAGCGTPTAPFLATSGTPPYATLGNASFGLTLTQVAPSSSNLFLVSGTSTSLSLGGGCTFFVDLGALLVTLPATADGNGTCLLPLPIPPDGTLDGGRFTVQAAEIDLLTGSALGAFDLSNGLTVKLGILGAGCN